MSFAHPLSARSWVYRRSLADPRPSPDGQTLAFLVSNGSDVHLALMPATGGAEQWVGVEPAVKRSGGALDWMPDGSGVVYIGSDGRVHTVDLATEECQPVTTTAADLSALAVSPDGQSVAYVVDTAEVVVMSLADRNGNEVRLSSGADFVFDPAWSPDSAEVVWHEWDVPNMPWDESRICRRRADGGGPVETVFARADASVAQPRYSPDGRHISFLCDANGFLNVWVVPTGDPGAAVCLIADGTEHGPLSWGTGNRSYCWQDDGAALYFTRNVAGWGSLWRCSLEGGERAHVDDGFYNGLSAKGGSVFGIRDGVAGGAQLVTVDADGKSEILMRSRLRDLGVGIEPRLVQWNNDAGDVVHGRLYEPPNESGAAPPLLVWAHGGPHDQSQVTAYARFGYFVERGWAVLAVDYRGSSGWGRAVQQSLNGHWGEFDVADVASGIATAQARGWGDPRRTAIYGSSAGGFTSLLVAALHPSLVTAAVAMQPISDLLAFEEDTWRFESHYTDRLVAALPDKEDVYKERSPLSHAGSIKVPLLILHGDNDKVVPFHQSVQLVEKVVDGGGSAELHIYEGEGHGWRNPQTQIDELERVHTFLRKHVLGEFMANEESK